MNEIHMITGDWAISVLEVTEPVVTGRILVPSNDEPGMNDGHVEQLFRHAAVALGLRCARCRMITQETFAKYRNIVSRGTSDFVGPICICLRPNGGARPPPIACPTCWGWNHRKPEDGELGFCRCSAAQAETQSVMTKLIEEGVHPDKAFCGAPVDTVEIVRYADCAPWCACPKHVAGSYMRSCAERSWGPTRDDKHDAVVNALKKMVSCPEPVSGDEATKSRYGAGSRSQVESVREYLKRVMTTYERTAEHEQ